MGTATGTSTSPSPEEQTATYQKLLEEVHTDIQVADNALMRIGENLRRIQEEKLYLCGGYATFADFCQQEIGKSRQYVYRLMDAYDLCRKLLLAGFEEHELPMNERICREVNRLSPSEQTPVWETALKTVQKRHKGKTGKAATLPSGISRTHKFSF
jgi:hypothetical protein